MTEELHTQGTPAANDAPIAAASSDEQSSSAPGDALAANDAFLDEKLAQPILRGDKGVDTAQVWAGAFLVVVAGLIAYSNAFHLPFQAEDQRLIQENMPLHSLATLPEGIALQPSAPFAMLTFAANWWLTPDNPSAFHAANILLHLAGGLVLFLLLRALLSVPVPVCMSVAMIYTLHPIHTAYVDCVVGRMQLLGLLFTFCALLAYVRARETGAGPVGGDADSPGAVRPGALGATLFFVVLAHYSGISMLGVLLLIVVLDGLRGGVAGLRRNLGAYATCWAAFGAVILGGVASAYAAGADSVDMPSLAEVMRQVALPDALKAVALHETVSLPLTIAVAAVIAFAAVLYRMPSGKLDNPGLRVAWGFAMVAVLATSGVATYRRNQVWASEGMLWADATERAPQAAEPMRQLARVLLQQPVSEKDEAGMTEAAKEAERLLRASLEIEPENATALAHLGTALARLGKGDEARDAMLSALRSDLSNKEATISLALFYEGQAEKSGKKSDLAQAAEYYKRANVLGGLHPELMARYGMTLAALGRFGEAEQILSGIGVPADDKASPVPAALKGVQDALKRTQDLETKALTLQQQSPADPAVVRMLAQSLLMQGRDLQAYYILERAIQNANANYGTWMLTGLACARLGMGTQFAAEYSAPIQKPVEVASAWLDLAKTCAADGLWTEATGYLESAAATAETGMPGLFALACVAEQLKQPERASEYLRQAAPVLPQNAEPWLRLCDTAIAAQNKAAAGRYLSEAESRGAAPDDIAARREKLGAPAAVAPAPPVTQ